MAALLTSVLDNTDKIVEYIAECKDCGIPLYPPDINHSAATFTVEQDGIRFGLVGIKNVGRGLIQAVVQERERGGAFTSMQNFCERMYGADLNKRALENLILSGAFDSTGALRSQLHQIYEQVLSGVAESRKQNLEGQIDFFGGFSAAGPAQTSEIPLPNIPEFSAAERMRQEKETTGLYLSGHPMDGFMPQAKRAGAVPILAILESCRDETGAGRYADGSQVCIAGVVTASKTKTTKNHSLMAYVTLEDNTSSIEMLCFSKVLNTAGSYLAEGSAILVRGRISLRDEKNAPRSCATMSIPWTGRRCLRRRRRRAGRGSWRGGGWSSSVRGWTTLSCIISVCC